MTEQEFLNRFTIKGLPCGVDATTEALKALYAKGKARGSGFEKVEVEAVEASGGQLVVPFLLHMQDGYIFHVDAPVKEVRSLDVTPKPPVRR